MDACWLNRAVLGPQAVGPNLSMRWLLSVIENFSDLFNRVPIAISDWDAQELLDLTEIADRFHLPAIQAQDESVLDRNDFQQPVLVRR